MDLGLTRKRNWKIVPELSNTSTDILVQIPCILFVFALLKVVSHYYLSVLWMSEMGFQKSCDMGVGGWVWLVLS